ncbi:MAG: AbrB/MazE/SpoVT family DNA-binding domain-containing protein [Oscillospiraceae bacterium]|nr:AbrB/MazE/SpoVT family DNA-binding domain-containing protein [Oscillospiraceae bacterium]
MKKKSDRYFMSAVKIGPKGQIVIPKEAREMFGLEPGDMVVLMADKKKGIAMQTIESLSPMLRGVFDTIQPEVEEDE